MSGNWDPMTFYESIGPSDVLQQLRYAFIRHPLKGMAWPAMLYSISWKMLEKVLVGIFTFDFDDNFKNHLYTVKAFSNIYLDSLLNKDFADDFKFQGK